MASRTAQNCDSAQIDNTKNSDRVYRSVDPITFNQKIDEYVKRECDKVLHEAGVLMLKGVAADRIVFIGRNGKGSTLGAVYDTIEQFRGAVDPRIWRSCITEFPVDGYDLECLALDGDDIPTMYAALRETWEEDPQTWNAYIAERTKSSAQVRPEDQVVVDLISSGVKTIDIAKGSS